MRSFILTALLFVAVAVGGMATLKLLNHRSAVPTSSAMAAPPGLAECLAKKGYVVYGASWCHYCKVQKKVLFGDENIERAPYVECEPAGKPENPACEGKPIDGYPTWIGPDGKPLEPNGALSAERLSKISGCPLR